LDHSSSIAYINRIDASPVAEGFGSELLYYIISQAKDHGFATIKAYAEGSNAGSRSMFRKSGFKELDKNRDGSYWELEL
jgi:L-amino acid N-acyltransferase YncA